MSLYNKLFFLLFDFFRSIKGANVPDDLIAIKVVVIISLLPILNLALIPIEIGLGLKFTMVGFLIGVNYLLFVHKDKYIGISKEFRAEPLSDSFIVLSIVYVIITIVAYFFLGS
jgi:hypothetical protein